MHKKNILIVITNFRHGGTNKSLQNLLSQLNASQYKVDVFAMEHYGPYRRMLSNCTILRPNIWLHALITHYSDTAGVIRFRSLTIKMLSKFFRLFNIYFENYLYKNLVTRMSKIKKYDKVIAFSEGVPTAFVSYFNNKNKIAWIRCDYSRYMELNGHNDETKIYDVYESIVCVSEYTKNIFTRIYPNFEPKTHAIHNIIDADSFIKLSKMENLGLRFNKNCFNIISIGRIDRVKRFDKIPEIASILSAQGLCFNWYLIAPMGENEEQKSLKQNIQKYKVEDCFFLIGEKDNPYPYIANCDLLVNLSTSEACPNVVNEAKILHTPVICTDFGSAPEFIQNGINGFISPIENIPEAIGLLIKNKNEYNRLKKNIEHFSYGNKELLEKIYSIL